MGAAPTRLLALVAPLVISLPLLAEATRKYVYPSNLVLPVTDVLAVIFTLALFKWLRFTRATAVLGVLILANVGWGLLTIAFGHQNFALGMVGLRNLLVPCAFLAIGAIFANAFASCRFADLLHRVFTWWLAVLAIVAVSQLLVGRDHWLNAIPEGLGDQQGGIGDYTVDEIGSEFLFRPTSIFLHTGKLGAVLFVLTSYRLCYAASNGRSTSFWVGRFFDLVVLLLSGQRAAIVGYGLVAVVVWAKRSGRPLAVAVMVAAAGAMGLAVFGSITASGYSEDRGLWTLIAMRVVYGIGDIPARVADNLIAPMEYVLDRYSALPAGLGTFSLGSASFGGQPLYEVVPIGTAENSWLRILAEQGLVGLTLSGAFLMALVMYSVRSWRNARMLTASEPKPKSNLPIFAASPALILGVLLLWANTHDVLGNVTLMSLVMLTFGVAVAGQQRRVQRPGNSRNSNAALITRGPMGRAVP